MFSGARELHPHRQVYHPHALYVDENDFQDVRKETAELAGLWQGLATSLGLSPADVREIDLANRGDPSRCLDGVIEKWLAQNYEWQKFGLPTWRKLVSAVADKSGGKNTALAKRIAQKHRECGVG